MAFAYRYITQFTYSILAPCQARYRQQQFLRESALVSFGFLPLQAQMYSLIYYT